MRPRWHSIVAMIPLLCAGGMAGCAFPDFAAYDDQSLTDSEVAVIKNRWTGCPSTCS